MNVLALLKSHIYGKTCLTSRRTKTLALMNFIHRQVLLMISFLIYSGTLQILTAMQIKTMLAAVLAKLRTGNPNARLSLLFKTSDYCFYRILTTGRDALTLNFVPAYDLFDHMNSEVARRNLLVPEALFRNPERSLEERHEIIICDGTYIYN